MVSETKRHFGGGGSFGDASLALEAFRTDRGTRVEEDGVSYDRNAFSRWQSDGFDRLYPLDPGTGYLNIAAADADAPTNDQNDPPVFADDANLGGEQTFERVEPDAYFDSDGGGWILFVGREGATRTPVAFIPDDAGEVGAPDA